MPAGRERTDWVQVGLIFVLGLFAAAQFGKISLTLDAIGVAYGRSGAQVAFLVSMVGAVGVVFGVIAGALVARIGAKRVLLGAIALGAGLSLVQALMPPLWAMTVLRLLEGVSHLSLVVAAPPLMAAAANDRDRSIAMSLWATFFGVSFALSAGLFPLLLAWGGVPLVFIAHGVGLAMIGILLSPRVPPVAGVARPITVVQAHREAYGHARIAAPGLGFVFYTLCYIALLTFLPTRLPQQGLGQILPLISLGGTLGAGLLARYIRPDLLAAAGFGAAIICGVAILSGLPDAVYPLFVAMGVIPGACFAAIPYFNASIADRSRASGTVAQMGNVGTTFGTPLFAVLLSSGGMAGLWWGMIVACLAGLAMIAVAARRMWQQS